MAIAIGLVAFNYYLWRLQLDKRQHISGLETQVLLHEKENQQLQMRNERKAQEIETLRSPESFLIYEEKARKEYGMIGENETFFVLKEEELSRIPDIAGIPDKTENALGLEMLRDSSAVPSSAIDIIALESVSIEPPNLPTIEPISENPTVEIPSEPILQLESLQKPQNQP